MTTLPADPFTTAWAPADSSELEWQHLKLEQDETAASLADLCALSNAISAQVMASSVADPLLDVAGLKDNASPSSAQGKLARRLSPEEEARREKNRLKVRRHYYRKLNQLNSLRTEVAQLESRFQSLLLKQDQICTEASARYSRVNDFEVMLQDLEASKQTLQQENEQLRHIYTDQMEQITLLRDLYLTQPDFCMTTPMAQLIVKPMSHEQCQQFQDHGLANVLSRSVWQTTRGAGVAGWQDERAVEGGYLKFSMSKTFTSRSAEELSALSWPILTNPSMLSSFFSAALEAKCVVVQQVNDDNIVVLHESRTMDKHNKTVFMKSLLLVSRLTTATGQLILLTGLSEDYLENKELLVPSSGAMAGQIVWVAPSCWISLDRAGADGQDCMITFAGSASDVGASAPFWTIELLMLVLRWESAIVGPVVTVSGDDDDDE